MHEGETSAGPTRESGIDAAGNHTEPPASPPVSPRHEAAAGRAKRRLEAKATALGVFEKALELYNSRVFSFSVLGVMEFVPLLVAAILCEVAILVAAGGGNEASPLAVMLRVFFYLVVLLPLYVISHSYIKTIIALIVKDELSRMTSRDTARVETVSAPSPQSSHRRLPLATAMREALRSFHKVLLICVARAVFILTAGSAAGIMLYMAGLVLYAVLSAAWPDLEYVVPAEALGRIAVILVAWSWLAAFIATVFADAAAVMDGEDTVEAVFHGLKVLRANWRETFRVFLLFVVLFNFLLGTIAMSLSLPGWMWLRKALSFLSPVCLAPLGTILFLYLYAAREHGLVLHLSEPEHCFEQAGCADPEYESPDVDHAGDLDSAGD